MDVRIKYKKIEEHYFIIALGIAFVLRILSFLSLQPWNDSVIFNEILKLDAKEYHYLATNIITNRSLENFGTNRTPGYPLFLALCYTVTGTKIWLVFIIQIILNLFSLIFVFRIAENFFSRAIGIMVILFGALDYHQIVYCNKLMTETLFTFFLMGSLYFLSKYILKKNLKSNLFLSGVFLGASVLIRPVALYLPLFLALVILFQVLRQLQTRSIYIRMLYAIKLAFIFLSGYLVTIAPWIHRNFITYGYASTSSLSGYNLLFYNVALTEAYEKGISLNKSRKNYFENAKKEGIDTKNIYTFQNSKYFNNVALNYIKNNKWAYLKSHLRGTYSFFFISKNSNFLSRNNIQSRNFQTIINMIFALIYFFCCVGIVKGLKLNFYFTLISIFVIFYFINITGVVGYARYRLPIMLIIYLFSAIGLVKLYHFFNNFKHHLGHYHQ